MANSLKSWKARLEKLSSSLVGQRLVKIVRMLALGLILAWLVYQLSAIGWKEVWVSRPRTLWFYVCWLGLYLQLPLIETFIYRSFWKVRFRELIWPILSKRALNQDVVSYAGEAYFFAWARRRLGLPDLQIFGLLKDNAILSSLASWIAALILISLFLFTGQIVLTDLIGNQNPLYVTLGLLATAILVALGLQFRKALFSVSLRGVLGIFAAHLGRFLVFIYILQILQWWVVLPEAPLRVWASMLAVMTIINRLPFLPAKDLIAVGAVLEMTDLLEASVPVIAAMLLVRSALDKVSNVALFGVAAFLERRRKDTPPQATFAKAETESALTLQK